MTAAEPVHAVSWSLLAALWCAAGLAVAAALARRGEPWPTAGAAVLFWPLLAPTLLTRPASRIHLAFDRLRDALRDAGEPVPPDLDALRAGLCATEARLAAIARMIAEESTAGDRTPESGEPDALGTLREAHERAAAELDAVLTEIGRVRVQLGLAALAGDGVEVRARLADLLTRARTLEEVAAVGATSSTLRSP